MTSRCVAFGAVCLALLGALGCGSGPDLPKHVPVSGAITLDGKGLARARVTFIPTGDTKGFGAQANTDEAGKYSLKGTRGGDGAGPGTYKVVVSKRVMPDGSDVPADDNTPPIESPAKEKLPLQYSNPGATTLTATVPAAGGTIDFPLKSK